MEIKVGDTLTVSDAEFLILAYDKNYDAYRVDIYNIAGNLIGHNRTIEGDYVRTCHARRK